MEVRRSPASVDAIRSPAPVCAMREECAPYQVSPCEEARDGVAREVVHPALLPELRHDGVDPGEPAATGGYDSLGE